MPTEATLNQRQLERSRQQYAERMKARPPTPSQDECNRIKLGEPIPHKQGGELEPEPEPEPESHQTRSIEARPSSGYSTRDMGARKSTTERPAEKTPASSGSSSTTPVKEGSSGSSSS